MFLPSNITLQFGDSGDFVAELQRRLSLVNCFDEAMINGFYDGATVTGVTSFQGRNGLHADGVAGPETLRRLNGVISGDTSSTTDNKKEEEAKREQAHAQLQKDQLIIEQLSPATYMQPAAPAPQDPFVSRAEPVPPQITMADTPPTPPMVDQQAQQREQILRAEAVAQMQQPAAPTPNQNDILAQMLLQQKPQPQPEQQTLPHQRVPGQPPGHNAPPGQLPPELQKPAAKPIEQTVPTPPVEKPALSVAPVASAEPEKPKGIIGRAIQAANSMIDKLGAYFESKLPPSVLNEVKAIGATMAKSGMKETEIPAGPELPSRAQELPGREQPGQAQAAPQRRQ